MTPWLMAFFCLATAGCSNVTDQQTSETQHDHQVAILKQIRKVNEDGSYTYGYEAGDGSFKVESRDVLGNVKGTFGFVDADGEIKRVSYSSSNGTGFKATTMSPLQEHVSVVQSIPRVNRTLTTKKPSIVYATTTTEGSTKSSVVQSIPRTRKTTTSTTTTTTSTTTEVPKTILGHYLKGTLKNRPRFIINGQQRPIVIEESTDDEDSQINRPSTDDKNGVYRRIIFAKRPIEHSLPPISEDFVEKEDEAKITTGNSLRRQLHDETSKSNSDTADNNDDHSDVYGGSLSTTRPLFTTSAPPRIIQRVSGTSRTERPKIYVNRENLGAAGRFDSPKYEDSRLYEAETKPTQEERTPQSTEPIFVRPQPEQYLRELPPRLLVQSQQGNLEEDGVYRAQPPVYPTTTDANVHYLTENPAPDHEDQARIAMNANFARARPVMRPLIYSEAEQRRPALLRPIPGPMVHPDDRDYQATTPDRRDFQTLLRRLLQPYPSYPAGYQAPLPRPELAYDQQAQYGERVALRRPLYSKRVYRQKFYAQDVTDDGDEILPATIREALLLRMVNLAINAERSTMMPTTVVSSTTTPASRYRKTGPVRSVQIITDDEEEEKDLRKKM
ncbi:hypothetical protein RF55_132 [Lasius niger]|uniref:Cuticle protein 6 n=1 Tax=Lasius niger TaxID=67767 RepID=A0A0J7P5Q3_LASNI|nr:hypothetical protein RF55_132 [Lasius niger]